MKADKRQSEPAGRYRKVQVRTWADERFRALSSIPACGQGLWLFLVTGPHTGPIPGLFRAGRASMAEELGWDLEAFDEAFREVFQQGMAKADFKARLVWLPNAIKHNRPESPNVVKSWAAEFDLLPECDLKREAFEALKASIHALGEAFGKAFDEAFGKPSFKAYGKPLPKAMANQEQEQEQEQDSPKAPKSGGLAGVTTDDEAAKPVTLDDLVAEGVPKQVASDWLKVRRAKKAPLTRTAWDAVKREAGLARLSPAQAVQRAAEAGWQGFKAEWLGRAVGHKEPAVDLMDGVH